MTNKPRQIFLTGVTGALGKEMLKSLLTDSNDRLHILVRPKNGLSGYQRLFKMFKAVIPEEILESRIIIYEGDVIQPELGLSPEQRRNLSEAIDEIYHIAALTALNGSEEDCRRINLEGTRKMLVLANECKKLSRFYYFSTAYVAGSLQTYCAKEDSLPENPAHANHYEASKYRAEQEVQKAMAAGLPATIFRPSIVVGDSRNGEVSEFNVIYPFMKLFAHGILTKLPTKIENTFNIVPIDFVVQSALAIAGLPHSKGKTYHLVSKNPPSIGMLLQVKDREYPQMPPIEIINPEKFQESQLDAKEQFVYQMLRPYLGYLNDSLTFDTSNTEAALKETGLGFPKTDYDFLSKLTRFAVDAGYLLV